ncbi:MAG: HAD family hydrolase [Leptospiraceae bacterium]|nr:HAD family hydrolase [Leptospiraceae bacterium]MCK6381586.1 HAD family hydrolase [Leptospiraceae bacterium]NUM40638.1 HAD family hydrolase [Leptospiraceae bacterium]
MNKFIFLDRDGVINKKIQDGYVTQYEEFIFLHKVREALQILHQNQIQVIVITNQQCIGKKIIGKDDLLKIHKKMVEEIKNFGGEVLDIFYCPHLSSDNCSCRKPKPGMLFEASKKYDIDLNKTYFIGDSISDIQAGKSAGTKTIYLEDKYNLQKSSQSNADQIFKNLYEAVEFILSEKVI